MNKEKFPKEEPEKYKKPGYSETERNGKIVYYTNGKDGYVVDEETGKTNIVQSEQLGAYFGIVKTKKDKNLTGRPTENEGQGGTFGIGTL